MRNVILSVASASLFLVSIVASASGVQSSDREAFRQILVDLNGATANCLQTSVDGKTHSVRYEIEVVLERTEPAAYGMIANEIHRLYFYRVSPSQHPSLSLTTSVSYDTPEGTQTGEIEALPVAQGLRGFRHREYGLAFDDVLEVTLGPALRSLIWKKEQTGRAQFRLDCDVTPAQASR